jgi:hypothetical protein
MGPDVVAHRESRRLFLDANLVATSSIGAWAEYDVAITRVASPVTMRVTLADRSSTSLDFEIATTVNGVDRYIVEHVDFAPLGTHAWRTERATMRLAGGADAAIPVADLSTPYLGSATYGTFVGVESLSTGVGTRKTKHIRANDARSGVLWSSDTVAPTGMVERGTASTHALLRATGG